MNTFAEFARDSDLIKQAEDFATERHKGQTRKFSGEPYINHPKAVAQLVSDFGGDAEMVTAAWLHDVVEDTGTSIEEIEDLFGNNVAGYVLELTHDIKDKSKKGEILADRMNEMSQGALLIKLCDRLNNVSDFETAKPSFVAKYKPETEYILSHLKSPNLKEIHQRVIGAIQKAIEPY